MTDERKKIADEALVEQFFMEHRQASIPDNGFAEKVMEAVAQLPAAQKPRVYQLNRIWSVACGVAAVIFLIRADALTQLKQCFWNIVNEVQNVFTAIDITSSTVVTLLLGSLTLLYVGLFNIVADSRYSSMRNS
ncbi:MAG: DUF5056 domain-containing protein [Prevotella sp.]|nr:DUF5056 domain-containing protein [Prevotella sp.]